MSHGQSDHLLAKGDWEGWIKFFLRGVAIVSDEATEAAKQIIALKNSYSQILYEKDGSNSNYQRLLDSLFENPVITKKDVAKQINVSTPTAGNIVDTFCELGILKDMTPEKTRYKTYAFEKYLAILEKGTELYS